MAEASIKVVAEDKLESSEVIQDIEENVTEGVIKDADEPTVEDKPRVIPPPGDGQKIYQIDPMLEGFRNHLDYRLVIYFFFILIKVGIIFENRGDISQMQYKSLALITRDTKKDVASSLHSLIPSLLCQLSKLISDIWRFCWETYSVNFSISFLVCVVV